jgi:hypothetical protein
MDVTADVVEQRRERLHALLWPPGEKPMSVWAVLDAARDPAVYAALIESRLEFRCLYEGRIPREIERVAPQLVELLPGHRLTNRLLGSAWGQAWGVFLRIEDPSNLRHHLRKLLKVRTEDGRTLLFRFYDPRVLGLFLPTCDEGQLRTFFGPVTSFVMQGERGLRGLRFALAGSRLDAKVVQFEAPAGAASGLRST